MLPNCCFGFGRNRCAMKRMNTPMRMKNEEKEKNPKFGVIPNKSNRKMSNIYSIQLILSFVL